MLTIEYETDTILIKRYQYTFKFKHLQTIWNCFHKGGIDMANERKEERVAREILENIGGKENIKSMEHCATRLRLILHNKDLINTTAIENIDGVKGQFFKAAQFQIILGTGFVNKVYDVLMNDGVQKGDLKGDVYSNMTPIQKISRTFGDIFLPIIPVLVATGLCMGCRTMLVQAGILPSTGTWYTLSKVLTDTAFTFLPALVTWSTCRKFGGTPVIGIVLGLMLVSPDLPSASAISEGAAKALQLHILGLNLSIQGYQSSVLPALCLGIISAKIEKGLRRIVPDVVDLIVTPFVTLVVSLALGLLIVGPIMNIVEIWLLNAFTWLMVLPFGIGGILIGGTYQGIVVTGLHQIFNALEIELLATVGRDQFNGIITGTIIAQGAAALAVALKTKDKKKRSFYISCAIPAFFGITEPSIFGVNLRLLKPFAFGLIGGACAGGFAAFMHLAADGMGVTVLPGILVYIGTGQVLTYIITNAIGFIVGFVLTFLFFNASKEDVDNVNKLKIG